MCQEQALQDAEGFAAVTSGQISIPAQANDPEEQKLSQKGSDGSSSGTYGVIVYWQPNPETDYEYNLSNYPDKDADGGDDRIRRVTARRSFPLIWA